jgi:uncharacterized protein (TIGR03083 family)
VTDREKVSKAELLQTIEQSWGKFHNYLKTLTPEQLDGPTDAVGWTVKDHLTHLMVWENGIYGMLNGRARWEQMNVDKVLWDETFRTSQFDPINEAIRDQFRAKSAAEVIKQFEESHELLMAKLRSLSEEDFKKPTSHFQADASATTLLVAMIPNDTYEHYDEHAEWFKKIVNG